MNDDSDGTREVLNMIGVMFITALEMLHESNLIGLTSPLPDNVGVITLLFLEFMTQTCSDYDLEWCHEAVRAADKYGVVLTPPEQTSFGQDELDELREECEEKKLMEGLAWKTEVKLNVVGTRYRADVDLWHYPKFKKNHTGGKNFDITKLSKKEKAQYEFGGMGSESD